MFNECIVIAYEATVHTDYEVEKSSFEIFIEHKKFNAK